MGKENGFFTTEDPTVIITHQDEGITLYHNWFTDEQWIIMGYCNHNGKCLEGAVNPKVDECICGMWVRTDRKDIPVRPEIECCPFIGVYLNGN